MFLIEHIQQLWLPVAAVALVLCAGGLAVGFYLGRRRAADLEAKAEKRAIRLVKDIEAQSKAALLEEKREWHQTRATLEKDLNEKRLEIEEADQALAVREKELEQRLDGLHLKEDRLAARGDDLATREIALKTKDERLARASVEYKTRLESLAKLTADEAKRLLLDELRMEVKQQAALEMKELLDQAKETASRDAKKVIALAIERCAVDQSTQSSVAVVPLPNDQIKARIIGKDGRNIRTFEAASGVKVMVDDTPEAVVISCFDPIRREIARISMEQLVSSGKITQSRIEEVIAQSQVQIDELILKEGVQAVQELKLDRLHPEMVKLVGRMRFRTSYGQNALEHSKEVAYLTGMMAAELGIDEPLARRAGLLHDIGKAVDHEVEGSHPEIGLAYALRYGEPPEVQNAIAAHHDDAEILSPITFLVSAADAISGARPGARRNDPEDYIKRVIALEELARSFSGVADAYAINAGREIRVMVRPDDVSDAQAQVLAFDIAQKIRAELTYPGQIKVTVIRGKIATGWTNQTDQKRGQTVPERRRHQGHYGRSSRQERTTIGHTAAS
ncbi:MAG: ribonuclease Y [Candidatus Latescibacteria bacterium]|nr:ribonuclease Y [Candidatus Latescibacterota bacterium]